MSNNNQTINNEILEDPNIIPIQFNNERINEEDMINNERIINNDINENIIIFNENINE